MKVAPIAFLLLGCGGAERPACAPETLATLEAAYVAEVLSSCPGYKTPEECPAYPEIRARFQAKRAEWEQCK